MATIVTATVSDDSFVLGSTLSTVTHAEVELVRTVGSRTRQSSLMWGSAQDPLELTEQLTADDSTHDVSAIAEFDGGCLYNVTWNRSGTDPLAVLRSANGIILDAWGNSEGWNIRLLFSDRNDVSTTHDACLDHDIELRIRAVCPLSDPLKSGTVDLTTQQYDTLKKAFDAGYYEIPRRTTLQELANTLGVSHQALSERVRRGHGSLVSNVLLSNARQPAAGI